MNPFDYLRSRPVDPSRQHVVAFITDTPPHRGSIILVDGERCRVTTCHKTWEGNMYTITRLRVTPAP